jgi:hypothetical protein
MYRQPIDQLAHVQEATNGMEPSRTSTCFNVKTATKFGVTLTDPIGLDGLYRKGELTHHGFGGRLEGVPRVNAVKGTWQDDHTFLIDRLALGLGEPAERWTLTFDGETLNVRVNIPERAEISIDSETGG